MQSSPKRMESSPVLVLEVEQLQTARRQIAADVADPTINARDKDICRYLLLGIPPGNIAEHFGISVSRVNQVTRRPEMQRRMAQLEAQRDARTIDISQRLKDLVPKAFDVIFDAIEGTTAESGLPVTLTPKDRVDAAFKVLAIDGHSPVTKAQNTHLVGVCDEQMLQRLASRSIEEDCYECG